SEELRLLSTTILTQLQEINTYADKKEALTRAGLQPLTEHVHHLEQTLKRDPAQRSTIFKKLHSTFEETDFISIQNAGLVILWPFLPRFFENLKLTSEGKFHDHEARMKAVCALQYLCYEEEELFFEGILPLNKVLCGLALEEVVEQASLSAEEKEQAEGLLHSVISRGPLWTNLSLEGFRTSYLRREGLLRTRDDRWILQIKKETHDVTLQKLPWGFNVVKLPWMSDPLMVEWG
ncbi:MAG: contractile injection system tape measure protein, partial [Bacteroidota bacterium]